MKVGDLVKWRGRTSVKFPGPRFGILLCKESERGGTLYWHLFMEGKTIVMDEMYWEVINENR